MLHFSRVLNLIWYNRHTIHPSGQSSISRFDNHHTVLIGRKHDNYTGYEYFKGVVYDVRIYNKVITTDVIKKLHKN
ncbi:MAG: hypothetical protein GXY77_11080 [Fibrobacter sp.]|nr:hypothetical protein [Fibrobacter sp.]